MRFRSDEISVDEGIPFKDIFLLILMDIAVISNYVPMLLHKPCVFNRRRVDK
jgi:hypothetical protein